MKNKAELEAELDILFEKIADGNITDEILNEVKKITKEINSKNIIPPLSLDEWAQSVNIEQQYESFHNEYGDAAALFYQYKQYHYEEYLRTYDRNHSRYP